MKLTLLRDGNGVIKAVFHAHKITDEQAQLLCNLFPMFGSHATYAEAFRAKGFRCTDEWAKGHTHITPRNAHGYGLKRTIITI